MHASPATMDRHVAPSDGAEFLNSMLRSEGSGFGGRLVLGFLDTLGTAAIKQSRVGTRTPQSNRSCTTQPHLKAGL